MTRLTQALTLTALLASFGGQFASAQQFQPDNHGGPQTMQHQPPQPGGHGSPAQPQLHPQNNQPPQGEQQSYAPPRPRPGPLAARQPL